MSDGREISIIVEASGLVRFKDAKTGDDLMGIRFVADTPLPARWGTLLRCDENSGEQVYEDVVVTQITDERRRC